MKLVQITGPIMASLLAACAANSPHVSAPQRAAQQAEDDKHTAQEEAHDARRQAQKEQQEAQEATRAQHEAEQKAQWASQRASLAEAQAAREAKLQQGTGAVTAGATERQADATGKVAVSDVAVLFAMNSAELSSEAKAKLDALAEGLRAQSKPRDVLAQGYTDDAGPESTNMQLSQRRANAVADYLESKGVSRDRIATKASGSLHPVSHEGTERARAANRRVEVLIQPAAKTR